VDLGGADPQQVVVNDGPGGTTYQGGSVTAGGSAAQVAVGLSPDGTASGPGVTLTVGAGGAGLVAADDGGTWAGVTDLQLPFP